MDRSTNSEGSDRRREVRYPYRCNLRLRQQGGSFLTARTVNLSMTGMSLILPENFQPDSGLELLYYHPKLGPTLLEAFVRFQEPYAGEEWWTGVRLDFRSFADRCAYQQLVSRWAQCLALSQTCPPSAARSVAGVT